MEDKKQIISIELIKEKSNGIAGIIQDITINGIQLHLAQNGTGGPIIFWGMYPHQPNEVEHLWESLQELVPEQNFLIVAFQVEDWNRDFSPWKASAVFGKEGFEGQGLKTLRWLTEECVPYIDRTFGAKDREHWLMGYSLAGLFALWAAYESDIFSGIICCSGSLWFPDWDHYVKDHTIQRKCSVYLSLGGKEEKTKNKVMAAVGDRTRVQERLLQEELMVESMVLEWNAGGHFADAGKRLTKGVRWMFETKFDL